jgi:hypothetical protein
MDTEQVNTELVGAEQVPVENAEVVANVVPVDAGSEVPGGEAQEGADAGQQVQVNPFDFSEQPEEQAQDAKEANAAQVEPVYELELGEAFGGSDDVRRMITFNAKEAGISAEAGSRFVTKVCEHLREESIRQAQEGYRALEDDWKGDFSVRVNRCKSTLHAMLNEGLVTQQDMPVLMNQAVFRVVDRLVGALGERSAEGARQAAAASAKAQYDAIMSDTKGETFKILMNPSHPKYRETAEYMNRLAGARIY